MKLFDWARTAGILAVGCGVQGASAEVANLAPGGFEVKETMHIAATPERIYAVLLTPARWWNSEHTFSGDSANLTLDARAGGCWCESLPDGGSVQHMTVAYLAPGKMLRLRGALGPLQGMAVEGAMTWTVKSAGGASDLSVTYAISGYSAQGFEALAKAVDQVLSEQVVRLKKAVETTS